jgi:hypothetical protein
MLYQAKDLRHNMFNIASAVPNSVGTVAELAQKYAAWMQKVLNCH